MSSTVYHSGHLLTLARKAYERSLSQSSDAMTSIMLSAVSFECHLNELAERLSIDIFTEPSDTLSRLRDTLGLLAESRASVTTRFDAVHLALCGRQIDRGASLFQDLKLLYQLRNALVHRRPEKFEWELVGPTRTYEPHQLVKQFVQRHVIPEPHPSAPPSWSQYVLVPETARWGYNTVVRCSLSACGWLPEGKFKSMTQFLTREWQEIAIQGSSS